MQPSPISTATQAVTKDRILDAAEALFSDKGFDATSLRMITAVAKVNLAAVNYHFQSKEALLHAVYARRAEPVNRRRLELLSAYEGSAEILEVEPILDAFMRPLFEIGESRECIPRLMVRLLYLDSNETSRKVFEKHFMTVFHRFQQAMRRALPHLSEQELALRMQFVIGSLAHTMAGTKNLQILSKAGIEPVRCRTTLWQLIHFAAAGLRAPVSEEAS